MGNDLFKRSVGIFSLERASQEAGLHWECIAGTHFIPKLVTEFLAPLQVLVYLFVIWCLCMLRRRPFHFDKALNTVAAVWSGLLITITGVTMKLFIYVQMPNGKKMVRSIPELERHSMEWIAFCPAAFGALLVYTIGFLAYVIHSVWTAPRNAATSPGFLVQYRFAYSHLDPAAGGGAWLRLLFPLALCPCRL